MKTYAEMIKEIPTELKGSPASVKQKEMYTKLCTQKKVDPICLDTYNGVQLYALNDALMKIWTPSTSMLNGIKWRVEKLATLEINVGLPNIEELGGQEVSDIIKMLDAEIEKHKGEFPPTTAQIDTFISMYMCIDVPFEDVGISRRVQLTDDTWRRITPKELKEQMNELLTAETAGEFIYKYKGVFEEWKLQRASASQISRIKQLESRFQDDKVVGELPTAITINGEEVTLDPIRKSLPKGTAFVPMSDNDLLLFDKDSASEYINHLEAELTRRKEWSMTEEVIDYEFLRPAKTLEDVHQVEYTKAQDILHQLEAMAGWSSEELHDALNVNLIKDDNPDSYQENRQTIRDFMSEMIREDAVDFSTLIDFIKDSRTLQRILLEV